MLWKTSLTNVMQYNTIQSFCVFLSVVEQKVLEWSGWNGWGGMDSIGHRSPRAPSLLIIIIRISLIIIFHDLQRWACRMLCLGSRWSRRVTGTWQSATPSEGLALVMYCFRTIEPPHPHPQRKIHVPKSWYRGQPGKVALNHKTILMQVDENLENS